MAAKIKICEQCEKRRKIPKDFSIRNKGKYVPKICKACECENSKKRNARVYADPKEKKRILARQREYNARPETKSRRKKVNREKYENDPERRKEQVKAWRLANPELNRKNKAAWFQRNKEKIRAKWNERYRTDPSFRLRQILRSAIWEALRFNGGDKAGRSILKHLPYSMDELRVHLESQWESWMSWDNYGLIDSNRVTWQIDHVIPQHFFNFISMEEEEFFACWDLSNLRPLESSENVSKGARPL